MLTTAHTQSQGFDNN